jgi:hypothetical protein
MDGHATAETSPAAASFAHKCALGILRGGSFRRSKGDGTTAGEGTRRSALARDFVFLLRAATSSGCPPRGSTVQLRGPATRPIRAQTAAPLVSLRRHVGFRVEVKGSSSIRRQIYAQPICLIRASRSKVRFVASPSSTPRIQSVSPKNVPWITTRVLMYLTCFTPTIYVFFANFHS